MGKMHFNHPNHPKVKRKLMPLEEVQLQSNNELQIQSRAITSLKEQNLLDRKRRLQLIKKMKRELDKLNSSLFKLKLAVGASLIISLLAILWH